VLQAADIALYKAELVPVGEDQLQHLELAREITRKFNNRWGKTFPECEALLTPTKKVPGLDGKPKMSKSTGNALPLKAFADEKQLWDKYLKRAVTDPARVMRTDPGNPDICNIYTLHKEFSSEADLAWVREGCTTAGIGCSDCKQKLMANMLEHFKPYVKRREELLANRGRVAEVLEAGAEKARAIAKQTMTEVHKKLGLWRSR
jgi:tryptophanyl-tRNA synthetase